MLTHVIKRNGRKVKFQPEKINKLSNWASESGISWSDLALKAVKKLHDNCTVQEILDALIKTCIDEATEAHLRTAGKLYVADLYKRVFNQDTPISLIDHLNKMISMGYYLDFNSSYSQIELLEIDKALDHQSDFKLSYTQIHQMESKYLVRDRVNKQTYETPQFMYARIALAVYEKEKENRLEKILELIEILSNDDINLPSPNWSNIGTTRETGTSCCLFSVEDTIQSISAGHHIADMMNTSGAGLGNIFQIRSQGDPVKGGVIEHQGKLGYYRAQQSIIKSNKQGCYDKETDILTSEGFINFSKVTENTLIAQVDDALNIEFVKPTRVVAYHHKGDMYNFKSKDNKSLDINVTPDHRMVYKQDTEALTFSEKLAVDFEVSESTTMFTSGLYKLGSKQFNPLTTLQIIYQSFGSIEKTTNSLTFTLSQPARIQRIKAVAAELSLAVVEETDGQNTTLVLKLDDKLVSLLTKNFSLINLENCSSDYINSFLEEFEYWNVCDVHASGYCSKSEQAIDTIQAMLTMIGVSSYKTIKLENETTQTPIYVLDVSVNKNIITTDCEKTKTFYDDMVYCVEVPSNKIIIRREGTTLVCGNSRGGALTTYIPVIDPQILTILKARNPTTVTELRVDEIDYSFTFPEKFWHAIAKNEDWMLISIMHAPDLYQAMYSDDPTKFEELFNKYKADDSIPKTILKAREIADVALPEQYETGRLYHMNLTEANRHTPFKVDIDPLYTSNLCLEIVLPHKPFNSVLDLYDPLSSTYLYIKLACRKDEIVIKEQDEINLALRELNAAKTYQGMDAEYFVYKNEIALCNIGAINLGRDYTDYEYETRCYHMLKIINYVINNSKYAFPNVEYTAKARMSAGVGMSNLAHEMARKLKFYSAQSGKKYIHFLAERHYYCMVKASLRISKEEGKVADWMYKTKWADETPWLPIDTYNREVDNIVSVDYAYDWEQLRKEIKENGGLYHSTLTAYMPCESSAQKAYTTNSVYPVRKLVLVKTDGTKKNIFIAPEVEELDVYYELAFTIPKQDLADVYAIIQKFNDQSISADFYRDFTQPETKQIGKKELYSDFIYKNKVGLKTQYYTNSKTQEEEEDQTKQACGSGGCTL